MYYPEDVVEDVRTRNDIVDLIGTYVKLQRRGSNYIGLCPFHSEKTGSFTVNQSKQMYYCFGCGAGGNIFTFLMEYENFTFAESLKLLAERSGVSLPEVEYSEEARRAADLKGRLLEISKEAAKYFYYQLKAPQGSNALSYLHERKLQDQTIRNFGLGFANKTPNDLYLYLKQKGYSDDLLKQSGLISLEESRGAYDKFWNRVIFPIMDSNGKVIGFGGRVLNGQQEETSSSAASRGTPKYLNSPETKIFEKSRNLYGLNFARTSRKTYLLICEGYMDVIALHQAGFTNTVASLGTAFTGLQANLLSRYTKEVILTYDNDNAGVKATLRAIPILKEAGLFVRVLDMQPYKDPDDFIQALGKEEFENRIQNSVNSFYFEADILSRDYRMEDPEQRTRFVHLLAEKLALSFSEKIERESYNRAVAARYSINPEDLLKLVNSYGMKTIHQQVALETRERERKQTRTNLGSEQGILRSQKLLLTWLSEEPRLFEKIKDIISVEDFTEEIYQQAAKQIFEQYKSDKKVSPAKIISRFEEKETQTQIADIFNAKLSGELNESEKQRAFTDTIVRIRMNSLETQIKKALAENDVNAVQRMIDEKAELQKLHISLNAG